MTNEQREIIEGLGWKVAECVIEPNKKGWEISKYSPAGENFIFSVEEDDDLVEKIREYAADFSPDERIEMEVDAKYFSNTAGNLSIRDIVGDADAIDKMLQDLASALSGVMSVAVVEAPASKWVVTRTYNFDIECNAVVFDSEETAVNYMRNWYLRDLEAERKEQQEMDEYDRTLCEEECSLDEELGYARIAWGPDEHSSLELCEYNVIQTEAPSESLMGAPVAPSAREEGPACVRVFLWDGIVDNVIVTNGRKNEVVVDVINGDRDYSDKDRYEALQNDPNFEEANWTTDSLTDEEENE